MSKIYKLTIVGNNRNANTMGQGAIKSGEYYLNSLDEAWNKLRAIYGSRVGFSRDTEFDVTFAIKELDLE